MRKILFLVYHGLSSHSGISKKILAQVDGLRANGADVRLCTLEIAADGTKSRVVDGTPIRVFGSGLMAKIRKHTSYSDIVSYVADNGMDTVYIRYDINSDPFTVALVRQLHRSGLKVIVEIPTWPYDGEFKGQSLPLRLQLLVDKCFRKRFWSFCDRALVYTDDREVIGCKTINISNGVDFSKISTVPEREHSGRMRMLSVANIHLWHGLDRLIRGMGEKPEVDCCLHIVGDGLPEIFESYRELAKKYGIEDRVMILGPKFGKELDDEFDWADIAVGSLGRHRSGITDIKTLKNREYAARGLAFFYSEHDSDFDTRPYVFKVPADESPVDVEAVRTFLDGVGMSPADIRASISSLSWKNQMSAILDF